MGFYDESGVFKTKTAEEERAEQAARFKDAGKKIFILFWMNIGSIITSVFVFLGAAILGVIDALGVSGAKGMLYLFIVLIVIGGLAFSIVYGVILLSMGKYNDRMRTAGICYLVYEVLSILQNYLFSDNWIGSIMELVSIILAVIYLVSFTKAMEDIVYSANSYLSGSWETLRKMFIGTGIGMLASVVVAIIIPILGVLAIIICLIVLLVASVWNLVLLYKSAVAVRDYVPE